MKCLVTTNLLVFGVLKSIAGTEAVNAAQQIESLDQEHSKGADFDKANDSAAENLSEAQRVVEWVRSKGCYVSPKIEIQQLNKDDPNSPNGVFALEPIEKNETLVVVPVSCFLTAAGNASNHMCTTARNLVRQYKLQDKSLVWPYVSYLFGSNNRSPLSLI